MGNTIFRVGIAVLFSLTLHQPRASAAEYVCKVGDAVEGWNVDWYKATVTEVGAGQHAGYCYLKWEKSSTGQWIAVKNIRPIAAASKSAAAPTASATAPTTRYRCGVFLNGHFTQTQSVTLTNSGTYQTSAGSPGHYRFDNATNQITFEGGALASSVGRYETENHQIFRLTAKQDAKGSAQAQNWRSQVCSPQH